MKLKERFAYANDQAAFYERALKPALKPYVKILNDGENGKFMPIRESFLNNVAIGFSPYKLVVDLASATARFGYNFVKGPN